MYCVYIKILLKSDLPLYCVFKSTFDAEEKLVLPKYVVY